MTEQNLETKSFVYRKNEQIYKIQIDVKKEGKKHRIEYTKQDGEIKQTKHILPRQMHHDTDRANITPERLTELMIVKKKAQDIAEHYIQNL